MRARNMRRAARATAVAALAVSGLWAAPGCTDEGGPGNEGPVTTVDELCLALTDSVCDYLTNCCTASERGVAAMLGLEPDDCDDPTGSTLYVNCAYGWFGIVASGSATFDPIAAAECAAAARRNAASCPNFTIYLRGGVTGTGEACDSAIVGTKGEGEECNDDDECIETHYCGPSDPARTCRARPGLGGPCIRGSDCVSGLVCVAGACAQPSGEGGPCNAGAPDDAYCRREYYCDPAAGTCRRRLGEGQSCAPPLDDACGGACSPEGGANACIDYCNGV